ncbi:hypothetical protein C5973_07575 [Cronobacter sakazakii]|nr:hypothetical protein C5973_07575 [Cronobacter sakazakii]
MKMVWREEVYMEEMAGALRLPTLRVLCVVFCRAGKQSAPVAEQKITLMQLTVGRVSAAHPPQNRRQRQCS